MEAFEELTWVSLVWFCNNQIRLSKSITAATSRIFLVLAVFCLGPSLINVYPVGNGFVACRVASCGRNAKPLTLKSKIYNPYCRPLPDF